MSTTFIEHGRNEEERRYYALMDRVWSVLAPIYDALVLPVRRVRGDVVRLAEAGPGTSVLDVATGTGAQALAFAEVGADVVGLDLSEAMLRVARKKAKAHALAVDYVAGDARAMPFDDERFDVTCIALGLHEMPPSVRQDVLMEMARVTAPDGKIVIVDYALPEGHIANALVFQFVKLYERDSYVEFVRADLDAMLAKAGLVPIAEARALRGAVKIVIASRSTP